VVHDTMNKLVHFTPLIIRLIVLAVKG